MPIWNNSPTSVLDQISETFSGTNLAVRSSAGNEDGMHNSSAGKYQSVLNIQSEDQTAISDAINRVIESYGNSLDSINGANVIVQEMVQNVSVSGVIFTQHMATSAPYYVINYDDIGTDTSTVTSGKSTNSNRSLFIHRSHLHHLRSERFQRLVNAVKEVEDCFGSFTLDIEFVIDPQYNIYLLQARPIPAFIPLESGVINAMDEILIETYNQLKAYEEHSKSHLGRATIWGQMPDWNPAEMIGEVPRKLASSLYSKLITDNAWWEARHQLGYKVPNSKILMQLFAGHPYINVRSSLQSYLPSFLDDTDADQIVAIWLQALRDNPKKHDKIEFEVAVSGYSLDLSDQVRISLGENQYSDLNLKLSESILKQTRQLFDNGNFASLHDALHRARQSALTSFDLNHTNMDDLRQAINDCDENGTIPFAIAARHAFIAKNIVNSMIRIGIITNEELEQFTKSIETVTTRYTDDLTSLNNGNIDLRTFMSNYGHLRPGTYDICSQRYDQLENPLATLNGPSYKSYDKGSTLWAHRQDTLDRVDQILIQDEIAITAVELFSYIGDAIVAREECKFLFTRRLSCIIEKIANYGKSNSINRATISNVDVETILSSDQYKKSDRRLYIEKVASENDRSYRIHSCIRMPELIFDPTSVFVVPFQVGRPNFVTNEWVTASIVKLDPTDFGSGHDLNNKLILIENADPGFDWIFGHKIKGLITKFGGVNSHMSIRCSELGLPAAIGCGFQIYNRLELAHIIDLDCEARLINVVS